MGQIQTAATGDEKFPSHRWFGIKKSYGCSAGGRDFRSAQARWATANDCDLDRALKQYWRGRATQFNYKAAPSVSFPCNKFLRFINICMNASSRNFIRRQSCARFCHHLLVGGVGGEPG
jgi:hypothetical protein